MTFLRQGNAPGCPAPPADIEDNDLQGDPLGDRYETLKSFVSAGCFPEVGWRNQSKITTISSLHEALSKIWSLLFRQGWSGLPRVDALQRLVAIKTHLLVTPLMRWDRERSGWSLLQSDAENLKVYRFEVRGAT